MAFKIFSVNETFTSSDANTYLAQQIIAIKTSTESVTSSITVQDDNELSMTLNANSNYWLDGLIIIDGAAAGDFRLQFVVPSGTIRWLGDGPDSSAAATTEIVDRNWKAGSLTTIIGTVASGTSTVLPVSGIIRTAASGGTFKLQWAQGTSSATATRVFLDSFLRVTRMKS
jgi:hypothetical protein